MTPFLGPEAPYDVDVAVLGAGPAGMAAAVRARWVKSYRALSCSVAVLDPGPLGGLAGWRTCSITGPGHRYLGDGLVTRVATDFERYHIPVLPTRAVQLGREGGHFLVRGADGSQLRALSVIVATGMRPLSNERHFLGRGLFVTYMGYGYFERLMDRVAEASEGGLVVFGNAKSANLGVLAERLHRQVPSLRWILDEPPEQALPELPGRVQRGRLSAVLGQGDPRAGFDAGDRQDPSVPDYEPSAHRGVEGVRWTDEQGQQHHQACSAILLDYNAWETRTRRDWDRLGLAGSDQGFLQADAWCQTSEPGVFAAGDITGRYRSTAMALGDGVNAGFGAVRYTQTLKFGSDPKLFAYLSQDRLLGEQERDTPALAAEHIPRPLVPLEVLRSPAPGHPARAALEQMDGARSLGALAEAAEVELAELIELADSLIEAKLLGIHVDLETA